MKGQAKRFMNHSGKAYDVALKKKKPDDNVSFLGLWRYATWQERCASCCGAALGALGSLGLVSAVLVYGELTALFVARHRARPAPGTAPILACFGGGELLPEGQREAHMEALVSDSVAFVLASLVIMAVQFGAAAAAVSLANWAAARMVTRLRLRLLRSVITQEIAFFDTNTNLNFASSLTEDMEKLRAGVGEHVSITAYLAGSVVCGATLALAYGWRLTLAGLSVVPASLLVAWLVARKQTACHARETHAYSVAGRVAEGALAGVKTVRAYAGEDVEAERYAAALAGASEAARARGAWAGAGAGLGCLFTYSLNAIVFAYGTALTVQDMALPPDQQEYHPGVMVTVLFCSFISAQNITMCQSHLEIFSAARGAAKSLFRLLERKSSIDALDGRGAKPDNFRGDIVFDNVHFSYPSRPDVKVLRGVTLRVAAGETVALVGGSGCGKSTLLQLLQRLYVPAQGSVAVDGARLADLNLHHYRTSIGVVGQEPVLFSGTIRENITLGAGEVSDEELVAAAKTAHAHQFISKLANGYDTELGERGAALSGGQKQRIAIARALLRRPALLLLDEPTSALDPASERQVQAALDAASRGRTTLVVSHRLSTIVNATRIVYMEAGVVREEGSHEELLARRGLYWRLVQEDLTTRSAADAMPTAQEADELEEAAPPDDAFRRSTVRLSLMSQRECMRRSLRVGSVRGACMPPPLEPAGDEAGEEGSPEEEAAAARVTTWQLLRLQRPEWRLVAAGAAASLLVGATLPAFAYLFSKLYGMFSWGDREVILRQSQLYAGVFLAVAALCGAVTFLQAWLFNVAGARLTQRLRLSAFRHYLRQEQAWFDRRDNSVGALCARLARDCAAVQGATGTRLGTVLQGASTLLLGVTLAMLYSWKMTLVSLLSLPCVMGAICLEGYMNKRAESAERRALERASRLATECALNVRTVQSLGVEEALVAQYARALGGGGAEGAGRGRLVRGAVYGLCQCAPTLGYTVSLAYGGYLIAREGLNYEYAILVSEALIYGAWMLAEALSFAPDFTGARRAGARVLAALQRDPAIVSHVAATANHDPMNLKGEVTFSDVEFEYPTRANVPVLRGLSLRLEPGQTMALVGASGCGKSTVMQLLLRNYEPRAGRIVRVGRSRHPERHDAVSAARLPGAGAAGAGAVRAHHPREHRVRRQLAPGVAGGGYRSRQEGARALLHRNSTAGLRDRGGRRRRGAVGRTEAARGHRACAAASAARATARRAHLRARRHQRKGSAGGAGECGGGAHHHHHRAPPRHRAARAHHLRAGARPSSRARHARPARASARPLLGPAAAAGRCLTCRGCYWDLLWQQGAT